VPARRLFLLLGNGGSVPITHWLDHSCCPPWLGEQREEEEGMESAPLPLPP
jgi:hypothetical protein